MTLSSETLRKQNQHLNQIVGEENIGQYGGNGKPTHEQVNELWGQHSLVSRPRPAFHCLQYGKAWRAWYLFSREHDVIGKWEKFSEQTGCISHISQLTTRSTLGIYDNRPPLARYMQ